MKLIMSRRGLRIWALAEGRCGCAFTGWESRYLTKEKRFLPGLSVPFSLRCPRLADSRDAELSGR